MSVSFSIMQESDLDDILKFESELMVLSISDEAERMMKSWSARWRKESLQHYLPMGWSFIARDEKKDILGYFLAQPLLFFDGNTQTLWVEHLQAKDESVRYQLGEIAYKLSREKHFQKVIFPEVIHNLKSEKWNPQLQSIWTTKISRPS